MRSTLFLLVPILAVAVVPSPPRSRGCGAAPRPGEYVDVNAEEAVILYDARTKTEHFVRRADFRTEAKDFGFLVPTPSKPELGETKAEIFPTLTAATLPRHVPSGVVHRIVRKRNQVESMAPAGAARGAPEVLDRKQVAGFDAVVLRADDVKGLKTWLEDHGYDARPALMTWLTWYVENQWIITAFKVSTDPTARYDRWAKAVRMSFQTDAPFYPYREPEDMRSSQSPAGRKLKVFFLADAKFDGSLGTSGTWAGKTVWANPCPEHTLRSVVDGLGLTGLPADDVASRPWFLTEFEDLSSPRPGTDEVFFHPARDQSTVERPVITYDQYVYVDEPDGPAGVGEQSSGRFTLGIVAIAAVAVVLAAALGALVLLVKWRSR
jgi:cell division septation protein DedD